MTGVMRHGVLLPMQVLVGGGFGWTGITGNALAQRLYNPATRLGHYRRSVPRAILTTRRYCSRENSVAWHSLGQNSRRAECTTG